MELDYPVFYWKRHDGAEVDFVIDTPKGIVAIEVKAAERWQSKFHSGIAKLKAERRKASKAAFGVYTGKRALAEEGVRVLPWGDFLRALWDGRVAS